MMNGGGLPIGPPSPYGLKLGPTVPPNIDEPVGIVAIVKLMIFRTIILDVLYSPT